jgi:hypothetical protein
MAKLAAGTGMQHTASSAAMMTAVSVWLGLMALMLWLGVVMRINDMVMYMCGLLLTVL